MITGPVLNTPCLFSGEFYQLPNRAQMESGVGDSSEQSGQILFVEIGLRRDLLEQFVDLDFKIGTNAIPCFCIDDLVLPRSFPVENGFFAAGKGVRDFDRPTRAP